MQRSFSLTEVERRILQFFREHPQAVETVRGIATWVGCEAEAIEKALNGLVGRRWIATDETRMVRGYALTQDQRILAQIQETMG
ncbi:MAG: hypothetical protein HYZ93_04135 [Candidatus Omnitrophica bacterium]|nr:hypothetical protein [Candidatus Omnitrophota bacterium]